MLEFKRQLITPSIAAQYLEANISNRSVKQPVVKQYANDMASGKWKEDTAECIKVSQTGIILDGQHRLMAVIKSNTSVFFYVATGLNDEVFDVIDTGSSRNASDTFRVKGIKRENSMPSIISMYNLLLLGRKNKLQKGIKSTNAALIEQYYLDENFWQNVAAQSFNWYLSFAKILAPSYIGGFYAFFIKLNDEKAEEFMKQLTTGIGITNDSILYLRNKLMQDKMSVRKMQPTIKIALIIKTWNHFVTNKNVKLLKYNSFNDEFPIALSKNDI